MGGEKSICHREPFPKLWHSHLKVQNEQRQKKISFNLVACVNTASVVIQPLPDLLSTGLFFWVFHSYFLCINNKTFSAWIYILFLLSCGCIVHPWACGLCECVCTCVRVNPRGGHLGAFLNYVLPYFLRQGLTKPKAHQFDQASFSCLCLPKPCEISFVFTFRELSNIFQMHKEYWKLSWDTLLRGPCSSSLHHPLAWLGDGLASPLSFRDSLPLSSFVFSNV